MENQAGKRPLLNEDISPEHSPSVLFQQIQDFFRRLGIFGQKLSLRFEGARYLISCDNQAFMVYQINEQYGRPPGVPGWPVCLVTAETIVDECSPPHEECAHFATGLALPDWLEIIDQYFRPHPEENQ